MKRILNILTTACLILSLFVSCKDEDDEPVVPTKLEVDKTSFTFGAETSKGSVTIFSNRDWRISTESSWLSLSPVSGEAESRITVEMTVSANSGEDSRKAEVIIRAGDLTVQVQVLQSGKTITVIDGIEIPDANFKQYLLEHFDLNGDGAISSEEAEAVTFMDCSGKEIESMTGLEYFINLDTLICKDNLIVGLDVSKNMLLTMLNCDGNSIRSLDLSANPEITVLSCSSNQMEELILSNSSKLTTLNCSSNSLATLEMNDQNDLETLNCSYNELSSLDLSNQVALIILNCSDNKISELEMIGNPELKVLICSNNQLTTLDVSTNTKLEKLDCLGNESLAKIIFAENQEILELNYDSEVTELEYPTITPDKEYVNIPDPNFKAYLIANFDTDGDGEISTEEALKITTIRSNRMDIATLEGIEFFPNLEVLYCTMNKLRFVDLSGNIKLKDFSCVGNVIGTLDLKSNPELLQLNCSDNNLYELDVSGNPKLEDLFCLRNVLRTLDLRRNLALNSFNCTENPNLLSVILEKGQTIQYVSIDSPPTSLVYMNYIEVKDQAFLAYLLENFDTDNDQKISELEINSITEIDCSNLGIQSLELSLFTNLTSLNCSGNKLTSLDLTTLTKLVTLICDNNQLSQLNISQNTALETLDCSHNELQVVNTQGNKELKSYICHNNKITGLNLSANTKLEILLCQHNALIRWMDVDVNLSLHTLNCQNNPQLLRLNLRLGQTIENLLYDANTLIGYVGDVVGGIRVPDSKFFDFLLDKYDTNKDGELSSEEASQVVTLDCSGLGIYSLDGIEHFTNLTALDCSNNHISSLNVSELAKLQSLNCSDNQISTLNVFALAKLTTLNCQKNQIAALDLTRNSDLVHLDCQGNKLSVLTVRRNPKLNRLIGNDNLPGFKVYITSSQEWTVFVSISSNGIIEVSNVAGIAISDPLFEDYIISNFDTDGDGSISSLELAAITSINCSNLNISSLSGIKSFTSLKILNCSGNKLTSLDLLGMTNLVQVDCGNNDLSTLNLSNMPNLSEIFCHDNRLTSIDVTNSVSLKWFFCPGNRLTTLNVSTNVELIVFNCSENSRLNTVYMNLAHHSEVLIDKDDHTNIVYQ